MAKAQWFQFTFLQRVRFTGAKSFQGLYVGACGTHVWDTQSDMGFALLGASLALLTLSRWHDRQLGQLRS